jgi:hypothetical protein
VVQETIRNSRQRKRSLGVPALGLPAFQQEFGSVKRLNVHQGLSGQENGLLSVAIVIRALFFSQLNLILSELLTEIDRESHKLLNPCESDNGMV